MRHWKQYEIEAIEEMAKQRVDLQEMAESLRRSKNSVNAKVNELGYTRQKYYYLYVKGKLVDEGTIEELSQKMNKKPETIYKLACKSNNSDTKIVHNGYAWVKE